jgi:phenylacetate-coenzyme A ligase PaaK-like adenylate-forming protein
MLNKSSTIFRALTALRQLRRNALLPYADIIGQQQATLSELRSFAYRASPFYQDFHKGREHAPLAELPVLTKSVMMERFDHFLTAPSIQLKDVRAHLVSGGAEKFRDRYQVVTTSGSTGNPGIFLFAPREWATLMASFARAREWAGLKIRLSQRSRMAVVSSTNERNLSARVGRAADTPFLPTLRLDATQPLPEIVAALNDWQPEAVVAYASMAALLAAEQAEHRLVIRPRAVFTSSEVLTAQMRERLEQVWGNVVFNEYASTETANIAAEDTLHHGMHVFEDLLIVENVDGDNQPVPPGVFGEKLLVTVLFSRTQPLIRYEISDSVRFADEQPTCSLPFRTIEMVQGRREDVLVMPGVQGGAVSIHPNVIHDVMSTLPNHGWQLVEEEHGLRMFLVPAPEPIAPSVVRERIQGALAAQHARVPEVRVNEVDAIPKAPSGKMPLIKALRRTS